ncbi:virulence factor BrkB family protein [Alkalilimnicola sp. S0819]|uniref:virulence factor BrkB family protein n=1 Tax=Alkalilimnicola sp. S0819 TaxID=2613922 RepID=UPI00186996F4|nr:virulence factor BrkB family protein [Alkalilimnicola sp. S0819]
MTRGGYDVRRLKERAAWLGGFFFYIGRRFGQDQCIRHATALAYTTLLSLVPLLTVSFAVLSAFPVFDDISAQVQAFLFDNLVPATGDMVFDYIQRFMGQTGGLTAVGTLGLVVAALLMISTIDKALNDIWRISDRRRPVQGFLVYWTVLTLSPVFLGASVAISSYLLGDWAELVELSGLRQWLLAVLPFLAEWLGLMLLYTVVPNRRVPLVHAALGALVAAILFELAKAVFALYVRSVPAYEVIYGALAAVPLFLVWLYVSWVVVLVGAEFTQGLSSYRESRRGGLADPQQALLLAARLIGHLWHAQQRGRTLQRRDLHRLEPRLGELALQQALAEMEYAHLVVRAQGGGWTLLRDPHDFTLLDLYRSGPYLLPHDLTDGHDAWDRSLGGALGQAARGVEQGLGVTLAQLLAEDVAENGEGAQ